MRALHCDNGIKIVIRHYPDRKNPCLCVEKGNQAIVVGTIKGEDAVKTLESALDGVFVLDRQ